MNWNFVAHIIRDVFKKTVNTIYYGDDNSLEPIFNSNEHSIGVLMLRSEEEIEYDEPYIYYWAAGIDDLFFSEEYCNLFISFNYNPQIFNDDYNKVALQLKNLLKKDGYIFLVNPGMWASCLGLFLKRNNQIEKEIKRYSMFTNENVLVYENI